jgi:hypothetical protein
MRGRGGLKQLQAEQNAFESKKQDILNLKENIKGRKDSDFIWFFKIIKGQLKKTNIKRKEM